MWRFSEDLSGKGEGMLGRGSSTSRQCSGHSLFPAAESREEVGDMNGLEVYISHSSYSDHVDSCPPVLKVELNESHVYSFNKYLVFILCQALS